MPLDSQTEENTLRAMLGLPSEPIYLDMKPADLLTVRERELLENRLREVERLGA